MTPTRLPTALGVLLAAWLAACAAAAAPPPPPAGFSGKLLLTGGVSTIDGAAGGGLSPWAVTGSYATTSQFGATAFASRARTRDYALSGYGAALSYDDRVELSLARQDFDTGRTGGALGLPGLHLMQDIAGFKLRLLGDAVLDSDSWAPQVAVGVLHKSLDAGGLKPTLAALGARTRDVELYLSATKLLLAQGVLVNGTLRASRANQNGLLGFGSSRQDRFQLMPEVSIAWLLDRRVAIGAEWRRKPDNLNPSLLGAGLAEDDWFDVFLAWAPSKHVSITLAWVDLGHIVPAVVTRRQSGAYLSAQLAF